MIDPGAVAAIFLAAGRSSRFAGGDKLLVRLGDMPLALHAARTLVDLAPARLVAICPDRDGPLAEALAEHRFEIWPNPHPDRGLSESLRIGVRAVRAGTEAAVLLCLADMPFVRLPHLRALLAAFDPEAAPVVASSRDGVPMPPALFARPMFPALEKASGDQGGRTLLAAAKLVPAPSDELADIDRRTYLPPR